MGSLKVDNIDGGEGSGNFGHKGVKGQQGGSAKQGGGSKKSSSSSESKTSKEEKKKSKNNKKSSSKENASGEENKAQTGKAKEKEHEKESSSKKESSTEKKVKEKPQKETSTVSNESGEEIDKENESRENVVSQKFAKSSKVLKFERKGSKMDTTEDVVFSPVAKLIKGSEITKIVDFAGGKSNKPVKVEKFLIEQYGGEEGSWKHTRGQAEVIDNDGNSKPVEIHWFESPGVGQVNMKIKRALKVNNSAENNSEAKKSKQKGNE